MFVYIYTGRYAYCSSGGKRFESPTSHLVPPNDLGTTLRRAHPFFNKNLHKAQVFAAVEAGGFVSIGRTQTGRQYCVVAHAWQLIDFDCIADRDFLKCIRELTPSGQLDKTDASSTQCIVGTSLAKRSMSKPCP